jgi:hypothetical protein
MHEAYAIIMAVKPLAMTATITGHKARMTENEENSTSNFIVNKAINF